MRDNDNTSLVMGDLSSPFSDVFSVITVLLSKSIPHNLFILKRSSFIERDEEEKRRSNDLITVILMPRKPSYGMYSTTPTHHPLIT